MWHLLGEPVLLLHHRRIWAHERLVRLLRVISQVEIGGLITGHCCLWEARIHLRKHHGSWLSVIHITTSVSGVQY